MHCYQTLLLLFLSISSTLAYEITRGIGEPLYEPHRIDLTSDESALVLYVRLCKYSVTGNNGFLFLRMTRFCYCTDEYNDRSCSYPGPTIITKDDSQMSVTIVNQLTGALSTMDDTYWNHFKNMDTTNIHTHGIHVSPFDDDVLVKIEPQNRHKFTYNYGYHYPGTFWYHAHHMGSTSFHVDGGLHGAQIMTSDDHDEEDLSKYKENILLFNWQYPIPKSQCIPDADRGGSRSKLCRGRSPSNDPDKLYNTRGVDVRDSSMCHIYCQMPTFQLDASGYVYDLETDLTPSRDSTGVNKYETLYFTNGQLEPIINDLEVGQFRRLRLINSIGQFFIQFKFPDACKTYLIAIDGIYLDDDNIKNFDLSQSSHLNELLVSPGARADVLIKCNRVGIYGIYASENNQQDPQQLPKLARVDDGYKLFSIKVSYKVPSSYGAESLPSDYPEKEDGTYLEDLSDSDTELECDCHCPFPNHPFNPHSQCSFAFEENPNSVNGKPFDIRNSQPPLHLEDSLSILHYDRAYEFNIDNDDGHVYHHHTNPFQYAENVGNNGFIAMKNVWADSFGNDGVVQKVNIRTWTRDYWGLIILHCHILDHEDEGMMGHFNILPGKHYCPYDNNIATNGGNTGGNTGGGNTGGGNYGGNYGDGDDEDDDDSAEFNKKKKFTRENSKSNPHESAAGAFTPKIIIPISIVVLIAIWGLVVLCAIFYKKHQKQKQSRTRVPTMEDGDDEDESVLVDEGQIELIEAKIETDQMGKTAII